jgi:ATP-dependent DNA helicase
MTALSKETGKVHGLPLSKLSNILMQMRKNCNHPDLITAGFDGSITFPSADELAQECGKLNLLDRLLQRLTTAGHKVLIFSQVLTLGLLG